jgi:GntR family histidine utilization transcriptional repressor
MAESPYLVIKRSIADGIAAGQWQAGQILPSEHALVRKFQVSRMTVNRAMRELANENLIRRVPGVGSFVAEPPAQSDLVEIRNIADEIAARGHTHTAQVLQLGRIAATRDMAMLFGIKLRETLYYSRILHVEDGRPLQLEQRFVCPALAPGYLDQDFTQTTPNEFLTRVAPLQKVEHQVRAVIPDAEQTRMLTLDTDEACLLVLRRTWSGGRLASFAELYHPGSRFALSGKFAP